MAIFNAGDLEKKGLTGPHHPVLCRLGWLPACHGGEERFAISSSDSAPALKNPAQELMLVGLANISYCNVLVYLGCEFPR